MPRTMKITDVIAHPLSVAYERASWTAHEYMDRAQLILVEVRTDQSLIGFGEISGGPQKQICDLVALFADVVKGMDPMGHAEVWSNFRTLLGRRHQPSDREGPGKPAVRKRARDRFRAR